MLGGLYWPGAGAVVAQDYAQSLEHYLRAAAQGLAEAQLQLGYIFYNRVGVAQDLLQSLGCFLLAAAQGLPVAMFNAAVRL